MYQILDHGNIFFRAIFRNNAGSDQSLLMTFCRHFGHCRNDPVFVLNRSSRIGESQSGFGQDSVMGLFHME
jgi:hypothetical protein